jgi:uncharacterized protein (TIGR02231 family)
MLSIVCFFTVIFSALSAAETPVGVTDSIQPESRSEAAGPNSIQSPIYNVTAPIQRVRLHPDEAWVTRVGTAKIQAAGTYRLMVSGLPSGLSIQDIRVSAKGPAGTALGDFGIGVEAGNVTESPEYQELRTERNTMQDKIDVIESDIAALSQEAKFLNEFRAVYDKDMSTKFLSGSISAASVVDMSTSLSDRLAEVLTRERKQRRDLSERKDEISRLDSKMRQMASARSASQGRANVEITVQRPGNVEIELSYRTRRAEWSPAYEARLEPDDNKLELVLFASIRQNSGEDWNGVKLEISNARTSRSLIMPTMPGAQTITWSEQPAARPRYDLLDAGASTGVLSAQNTYIQAPRRAPIEGLDVRDEAEAAKPTEAACIEESRGLATTWSLEGIKDVPADGEPYRFRIVSTELNPALVLMAVPRLDPTVYMVARFPIPSGIPLFPNAPMVHFAGNQRVGEARLIMPDVGRPIQLGFGPYRGVRVALVRVDAKKENIGTFNKETQWTLKERFEVSNDRNEPVTVEIQDRELRAGNDKVRINFRPEIPQITENQVPGIIKWIFDIKPQSAINIPFTWEIRVPQGSGYTTGIENLRLPD